jgi:hypothetical protein
MLESGSSDIYYILMSEYGKNSLGKQYSICKNSLG